MLPLAFYRRPARNFRTDDVSMTRVQVTEHDNIQNVQVCPACILQPLRQVCESIAVLHLLDIIPCLDSAELEWTVM